MSAEISRPRRKKPYEKPTLSEVALRPEEAVLGNCKSARQSLDPPHAMDCSFLSGGCARVGFVSAAFTLDIGGLPIEVTADDDLPIAAEGSARKFVRPAAEAGPPPFARVHARWGDPQVPPDAATVFDSGKGLWRLYRTPAGPTLRVHVAGARPRALSDGRLQRGLPPRRDHLAPAVVRRAPRDLPAALSPRRGVHGAPPGARPRRRGARRAASSSPDGRGWLFVGVSGAESRHCRGSGARSRGARAVRRAHHPARRGRRDSGCTARPGTGTATSPSPGARGSTACSSCATAPRNALTAVPSASTVARLFVCGFTPFHDAAGLDFSLGLLGEVAGACAATSWRSFPTAARSSSRAPRSAAAALLTSETRPMDSFKPPTVATDGSLRSSRWIEALSAPSPTACSPLGSSSVSARAGTAWDRPCATESV